MSIEVVDCQQQGRYKYVITRDSSGDYAYEISCDDKAVVKLDGFKSQGDALTAAHREKLDMLDQQDVTAAPRTGFDNLAAKEIAASKFWDSLNPKERKAYLQAHPKSRYGRKVWTPATLDAHLKKHGWQDATTHWQHPASRRKMAITHGGTHKHAISVTHPNGDISRHKTNSDANLWNYTAKMAKPKDNSGIGTTLNQGKGSLHDHLGVVHGQPIPLGKLQKLADSNHPLAGRARLVLNLKRARKRGPTNFSAPN